MGKINNGEFPVYAYDLRGNKVGEYESIKAAALDTRLNASDIREALENPGHWAADRLWRTTNADHIDDNVVAENRSHKKYKMPIYRYDKDGNLIKEYPSVNMAASELDLVRPVLIAAAENEVTLILDSYWRFSKIEKLVVKPTPPKAEDKVFQYDEDGNYVASYETFRVAGISVGGTDMNLRYAIEHPWNLYKGFYWRDTYTKKIKLVAPPEKKHPPRTHKTVPVYRYSLDGKLIGSYASRVEAEAKTGIKSDKILDAIKIETRSPGDSYWRTTCSETIEVPNKAELRSRKAKMPLYLFNRSGKLCKTFESKRDAEEELDTTRRSIDYVLKNPSRMLCGYYWRTENRL